MPAQNSKNSPDGQAAEPLWARHCRRDPVCAKACDRCRKAASRQRAFWNEFTDEEWEAARAWAAPQGIFPSDRAKVRRHVHEHIRRRNSPYEPERVFLAVKVTPAERDRVRDWAAANDQSISEFLRSMLGLDETA